MLNTFYHRAQNPWVYPVENQQVEVVAKVGKNMVQEITLVYGDALGLYLNGKWFHNKVKMTKTACTSQHEIWTARMKLHTKRYRYAFEVTPKNGQKKLVGEVGILKKGQKINVEGNGFTYSYWNEANFLNVPNWFRQTNWYQIFPDRFCRGGKNGPELPDWKTKPHAHEFYGGDIEGIIQKLDYIKDLGFTGIYLTPIFRAPTSHRYDTTSYDEIDPLLGDETNFRRLVNLAHQKGLKIMLDAVFNHIGASSNQWQDVLQNRENSKYKNWFWINDMSKVKEPHKYTIPEFQDCYPYETFSFAPDMPRLNWNNPEVSEYLMKISEKWTSTGIDGWRLDVSFEPSYQFWRRFKETVSKVNPQVAIIGEMWWDAINFLNGDMWHGVMNYPLRKVILEYVESPKTKRDKQHFIHRYNEISFQYTPEQQWGMFNLISSHDTVRGITLLNDDIPAYSCAMKMMFLSPGATSCYYGEEIGLEGAADPDNRRPMPWGESRIDFRNFLKQLMTQKKQITNNSSIHDRFVAKLVGNKIVIENSGHKIIVDDLTVNYHPKIREKSHDQRMI